MQDYALKMDIAIGGVTICLTDKSIREDYEIASGSGLTIVDALRDLADNIDGVMDDIDEAFEAMLNLGEDAKLPLEYGQESHPNNQPDGVYECGSEVSESSSGS